MNLVRITDLRDSRVAAYANLRDAELAQRENPSDAGVLGGVFIAEGELVVRRLLCSRFRTVSVLTTATRLAAMGGALGDLAEGVPVYLVDQRVMNQIVGFNMHRGVLAIGERGADPGLESVLTGAGPLVILEDLTNNDNLGAIFRNAAALGGPGCAVVLSPRCVDPLYRKSLRVSMGAVLGVPFCRAAEWTGDLERVRAAGFRLWGLTPGAGAREIGELIGAIAAGERLNRTALLLGSEGPGLSEAALRACDARVRIGKHLARPGVDSLNVGVAAGIALYLLQGDGDR